MKKIISILLVLAMTLSMITVVFAADSLDSRRRKELNAIVTANTSLTVGEKEDVYCQVFGIDESAYDYIGYSIEWYTTDKNVIQMPKSYLTNADTQITIKAVGVGTAKVCAEVTANYMGGKSVDYDYVEITVMPDGSIEVSPWTKSITAGESFTLSVSGVGFGGKATFWSDNERVATVDRNGKVTGVGAGTTNIWAEWNGRSDSCSVNVKGAEYTITALSPMEQTRSVSVGTSQSDLKRSFDKVYGYYLDSRGSYKLVECSTTWTCYSYNANTPGTYTFYGKVTAPDGYKISSYQGNTVTASVTVVGGYSITASLDNSKLKVGDTATLTVRLTDNTGKGVGSINGSNVQVALNNVYGCVSFNKSYVTLDSKGYGYVTVNARYEGDDALTAVAWANGSELCGTGIYFSVAAGVATLPFTDVPKSAWYYDDLANAYQMGLMNGTSLTKYSPSNNMTYAEAIKIAACMHQYYYNGKVTLTNGAVNWYDTYVEYAKKNGIPCDYKPNDKVTRSEYVHIFYSALPASAYTKINNVKAIPDMKAGSAHYDEILAFYNAGIITGDAKGNFSPANNITRAEVVAIINRMMNSSARKNIVL